MRIYLDASLLVAVLAREPESDRVDAWLAARRHEAPIISDWVATEFSSALARKLRMRVIDEVQRSAALSTFAQFSSVILTRVSVSSDAFDAATAFCNRHETGIRSGDALHLAVAQECGAALCTLDQKLAEAGPNLGVATVLV